MGETTPRGRKLCPKIILEGTRLTHKTEIAFALNEHPRIVGRRSYRYHSPIVSSEWCGFTNRPWGRGLINFLPDELELAMETYRAWIQLFSLLRYYSWIADRFHVSTAIYQKRVHGIDVDFAWLEEELSSLGFCHVLCTRRPETFRAAREARVLVSGKPSQYDDLDLFIAEQEVMRERVQASRLRWFEVDVSDGDVTRITDAVADWMIDTGALWQEGDVVTLDAVGRRASQD